MKTWQSIMTRGRRLESLEKLVTCKSTQVIVDVFFAMDMLLSHLPGLLESLGTHAVK